MSKDKKQIKEDYLRTKCRQSGDSQTLKIAYEIRDLKRRSDDLHTRLREKEITVNNLLLSMNNLSNAMLALLEDENASCSGCGG